MTDELVMNLPGHKHVRRTNGGDGNRYGVTYRSNTRQTTVPKTQTPIEQ